MKPMNKKGIINQLGDLIIPLVSVGIILVIGFLVMSTVQTQTVGTCALDTGIGCTSAHNGTVATVDAMEDIPGWLPIIIITVIGALLIGLVSVFRGRR